MTKQIFPYPAILSLLFFIVTPSPAFSKTDHSWNSMLFGARASGNRLANVSFNPDFTPYYMSALAVGKRLWTDHETLNLEIEGQFVKHLGGKERSCQCPACQNPGWDWADGKSYENRGRGKQDHEEYNLVLILRWMKFPWNRWLNTSFAVGEGLSYASRKPALETDYHAENQGLPDHVSNLLNYLLFEWSFSMPKVPEWNLVVRVHHRSGIYGLINGVHGGSNYIGLGIRYNY